MRSGARLFVFHQAPYDLTKRDAEVVKQILSDNAFDVTSIQLKKVKSTRGFCVISTPKEM